MGMSCRLKFNPTCPCGSEGNMLELVVKLKLRIIRKHLQNSAWPVLIMLLKNITLTLDYQKLYQQSQSVSSPGEKEAPPAKKYKIDLSTSTPAARQGIAYNMGLPDSSL